VRLFGHVVANVRAIDPENGFSGVLQIFPSNDLGILSNDREIDLSGDPETVLSGDLETVLLSDLGTPSNDREIDFSVDRSSANVDDIFLSVRAKSAV
jgi:hypothetical protein